MLHGSFDYDVFKLTAKPNHIKRHILFFVFYLAAAICIFYLFYLYPFFSFCLFLLYSAFHFGIADEYQLKTLPGLILGISILTLPTLLHSNNMTMIYHFFISANETAILVTFSQYVAIITTILILLFFVKKPNLSILLLLTSSLLALPLAFFSAFFCFEHSLNYIYKLNDEYRNKVTHKILYRGIVFTLISMLIVFVLATELNQLRLEENALFKSFIYVIAALSFPHIILIEYMKFVSRRRSLSMSNNDKFI